MSLPVTQKTHSWFRPHTLGGLVGMVAGVLLALFVLIILDWERSEPQVVALLFGASVLPIALDVHVYLARLLRVVRSTPTTPVRRSKRGYTELSGIAEAVGGQLLSSPQSDTPCVWHRLEDRGGRGTESLTSGSPFVLRDPTGQCLVDVDGAQVYARRVPAASPLIFSRFAEYVIQAGDPVYAIGDIAYVSAADVPRVRNALAVQEALRSYREIPGLSDAWKRASAYEYADETSRGVGSLPAEFGQTVKVLRKPMRGQPFLIVTGEAKDVERYFAWRLWVARAVAIAALGALSIALLPIEEWI